MIVENKEQLITFAENNFFDTASLGIFDGFHKGHQYLINKLIKQNSPTKLIITFIVDNIKITTNEQKIKLIENYINNNSKEKIQIITINLKIAELRTISPQDFIDILKKMKIKNIIVGKDYRFGYNATGKIQNLQKDFNVEVVPFLENDAGEKISSSLIKNYLSEGKIDKTYDLLGYYYFTNGIVKKGNQLGRTINFPTLNIHNNLLIPKGVYKTNTYIDNKKYNSITNYGFKPTIGNAEEAIVETHIYNDEQQHFNEQIYGKEIKVEFLKLIRKEIKMNNLEELKEQIKKDITIVKEIR